MKLSVDGNGVRCPKCGETINYLGQIVDKNYIPRYDRWLCPKCGEIKTDRDFTLIEDNRRERK